MQGLRRRRDLRCLALLALAAQIMVCFGHVHVARAADPAAPLACRTFFPPADEHQCPPYRRDDRSCAVCWTVALSGSLILPEPPAVYLPLDPAAEVALAVSRVPVADETATAFDARGPPSASLT